MVDEQVSSGQKSKKRFWVLIAVIIIAFAGFTEWYVNLSKHIPFLTIEKMQVSSGVFGSEHRRGKSSRVVYGIKNEQGKVPYYLNLILMGGPQNANQFVGHKARVWYADIGNKERVMYQLEIDGQIVFSHQTAISNIEDANEKRRKVDNYFRAAMGGLTIFTCLYTYLYFKKHYGM